MGAAVFSWANVAPAATIKLIDTILISVFIIFIPWF
jgi:hypothetical protein